MTGMFRVINCEDDHLNPDEDIVRVTGYDATWWTEDLIEQFQEETGHTFPQSMLEERDLILNSPNVEKLK